MASSGTITGGRRLVTWLAVVSAAFPPIAYACDPLWVSIANGEAKIVGKFVRYAPATVTLPCGAREDLDIAEDGVKFSRRLGSLRLAYDGTFLVLQIGLKPQSFPIPPNGDPIEVSLDSSGKFRGGAVLLAEKIRNSR